MSVGIAFARPAAPHVEYGDARIAPTLIGALAYEPIADWSLLWSMTRAYWGFSLVHDHYSFIERNV